MKISNPIYVLRRQAKELKRRQDVSLSEALNQVASREGFDSWSLLMSKSQSVFPTKYSETLGFLNDGDLVLVAARPGVGKTTFSIGLFAQAIEEERPRGFCFTLVESPPQLERRIARYSAKFANAQANGTGEEDAEPYLLSYSNDICAEYIISESRHQLEPGSLIIVDYLQLLSEKRTHPPLQEQVEQLKKFASEVGCIILFICQLDRQVESRTNQKPPLEDIRLPNPLDLGLFNKIILLYRETSASEEAEVSFVGRFSHDFRAGFDPIDARFFDL